MNRDACIADFTARALRHRLEAERRPKNHSGRRTSIEMAKRYEAAANRMKQVQSYSGWNEVRTEPAGRDGMCIGCNGPVERGEHVIVSPNGRFMWHPPCSVAKEA